MRHVTYMNEPYHTYEGGTSVTHMNESYHTRE